MLTSKLIPIFNISSVTVSYWVVEYECSQRICRLQGENLQLLTVFLNGLPLRSLTSHHNETESQSRQLFHIDEVFNNPEVSILSCVLNANIFAIRLAQLFAASLLAARFAERDCVQIGPDSAGNYRTATVESLRRNKQSVLKICAGEAASLAVSFADESTTRGSKIRKVSRAATR